MKQGLKWTFSARNGWVGAVVGGVQYSTRQPWPGCMRMFLQLWGIRNMWPSPGVPCSSARLHGAPVCGLRGAVLNIRTRPSISLSPLPAFSEAGGNWSLVIWPWGRGHTTKTCEWGSESARSGHPHAEKCSEMPEASPLAVTATVELFCSLRKDNSAWKENVA